MKHSTSPKVGARVPCAPSLSSFAARAVSHALPPLRALSSLSLGSSVRRPSSRALSLTLALSLLTALPAFSFHVQFGASGKPQSFERLGLSKYYADTIEIGAEAETVEPEQTIILRSYDNGSTKQSFLINVKFNATNPSSLMFYDETGDNPFETTFVNGAALYTPAIGYVDSYRDNRIIDCVFTMRGNPYSLILNDTADSLTINNTTIPARSSKLLIFPLFLKMEKVEGIAFYDLDSGTPIGSTVYNARNNRLGYDINWSGNIRIAKDNGTSATNLVSSENLVYGDLKSENQNQILYAKNGEPIRSFYQNIVTNIASIYVLKTAFVYSDESDSSICPKAYINNVCVCNAHSSTHIIGYEINNGSILLDTRLNRYSFIFTMSLMGSSGTVTLSCWDSAFSDYNSAPANHKASVSASSATFKITIHALTGEWKVEPL